MELRITRWGRGSAGVRVPAFILRSLSLRPGDYLSIRLMDNGDMRMRPLNKAQIIPADTDNLMQRGDGESVRDAEEQW